MAVPAAAGNTNVDLKVVEKLADREVKVLAPHEVKSNGQLHPGGRSYAQAQAERPAAELRPLAQLGGYMVSTCKPQVIHALEVGYLLYDNIDHLHSRLPLLGARLHES